MGLVSMFSRESGLRDYFLKNVWNIIPECHRVLKVDKWERSKRERKS